MRRLAIALAIGAPLTACHRHEATPSATDNAASTTSTVAANEAAAPMTTTAATRAKIDASTASDTHGFEDEFEYGSADEVDSGAVDAAVLAKPAKYLPYNNGRFGFALDVPASLVAMEEPTNGDGLQWRLGHLVAMTASGGYSDDLTGSCASPGATGAHTESKASCWSTGTQGGFIFWERHALAHGVDYSLRFQYAQSLKAAMDPIVQHVNKSWVF